MQSKAETVDEYLASLPDDRRVAIGTVRRVVRRNLGKGFEEGMQYGMIGWYVPHSVYPDGYHCDPKQPLPFAGLASQKNYMSLYLMCIYGSPEREERFRKAWAKTGKKLDMGKACVRFKKVDDLALDVIGQAIGEVSVKDFLETYEATLKASGERASRRKAGRAKSARKPAAKKPAARKKAATKRAARRR